MQIDTDDSWISVTQVGPEDADNIVLITGFIGVASFWDPILPLLSTAFRITLFDQRGTGNSGNVSEPLSMQQMARDAVSIIDTLNDRPVHLVGHSAGAGISVILAAQYPERIRSIVLMAGWTKADAWMRRVFDVRLTALKQSGSSAYAALTTLFMTPPSDVARQDSSLQVAETAYAQQMPAYAAIESRAGSVLEFDSIEWAGRVSCPALVIGARDDIMTPFYFSEALAGAVPNATLYALETGGHYFPRTRAEQTAVLLHDYLKNNDR